MFGTALKPDSFDPSSSSSESESPNASSTPVLMALEPRADAAGLDDGDLDDVKPFLPVAAAANSIACAEPEPIAKPTWNAWKVFASTFVTIFLAELGDKTQVSTLLMSAEFQAPWIVFAGAASALVTTSFLGVWLGCWLAGRLSAKTLDIAAGSTMALISLWLFWDVLAR